MSDIIDLALLTQAIRVDLETTIVPPFILYRHNGSVDLLWLEYSEHEKPTQAEIDSAPKITPDQTTETWLNLPSISVNLGDGHKWETHQAVCQRIPDGKLGVLKLSKGCLWTMIPNE